ncbi:MAG: SPOR domain-containing protein [Chromatiales bacterium]
MDEQLKQRLVGAAVIVSLIVIFVPMLLEEPDDTEPVAVDTVIPDKPPALQRPLPSREILPQPVSPVPMTSVAELEQTPPVDSAVADEEPVSLESTESTSPASASKPRADDAGSKGGRSTPTAWLVQVASFTQKENASRLVERLRQADMPAQVQEVMIAGKRHYRVQMLPQLDRKDAEKLIKQINQKFKIKATLRRYSE